jgi:hypothetical protein
MTPMISLRGSLAVGLAVGLVYVGWAYPALTHEATNVLGFPLGWKYEPGYCRSAAEPGGDCAPISSEYVTEGPDGWHIDLPKGAHPKLLTKGYSGVVPYGVEKASPEGNYHICLSTDGASRYCFYAGARGF